MALHNRSGVRRLAVAVLACAFYDAAGLAAPSHRGCVRGAWGGESVEAVAAEAYDWLTTPSDRLEFWAECAGLDMQTVIDGADAAVAYARRTPRAESVWSSSRRVVKPWA